MNGKVRNLGYVITISDMSVKDFRSFKDLLSRLRDRYTPFSRNTEDAELADQLMQIIQTSKEGKHG